MFVFFFYVCVIFGLLKICFLGIYDRKVWEKFCELREFKIWGWIWKLFVFDDVKLLVVCLIWLLFLYVFNFIDCKGKFWWCFMLCLRKFFWGFI